MGKYESMNQWCGRFVVLSGPCTIAENRKSRAEQIQQYEQELYLLTTRQRVMRATADRVEGQRAELGRGRHPRPFKQTYSWL